MQSAQQASGKPPEAQLANSNSLKLVVGASTAGTIFEWYDFFIFGALTATISKVFFSGLPDTASYFAALGLFGAGFAFRPLGALFFGRLGDKNGRKSTFFATLLLMGLSTIGIGLLPAYQQAGLISPAMLVALRVLQGFALGGEFGGAAIYVAEHAPKHRRGVLTSLVQTSAGGGLLVALLVILATRSFASQWGDQAFDSWGWRIPFLASAGMLLVALLIRMRLAESPAFVEAKSQGALARAPYAEVFGNPRNLKRVLLALIALVAGQTCSWYTTFFYTQTFMEKSLGVSPGLVGMLALGAVVLSIPLYAFFGWLSDRIGRKRVMATGLCLAAAAYFPGFTLLTHALNPQLANALATQKVVLIAPKAECSFQLDPVGRAEFTTACDVAKRALAGAGVSYATAQQSPGSSSASIRIGEQDLKISPASGGSSAENREYQKAINRDVLKALRDAGYPAGATPDAAGLAMAFLVLSVFVATAAAIYGPLTACLVELFPLRIRYTALSVPYHLGTGWIGGFLPFVAFAIVVFAGNIYAGLWYPFIFTTLSALTCVLFLPETRGANLSD